MLMSFSTLGKKVIMEDEMGEVESRTGGTEVRRMIRGAF
jgi:hypothetical protein